jgi:hypothetical protein
MNKFSNVLAIHCHTTGMNFNGPKTLGHQPLTISLAVFDLDNLKIVDSINVAIEYNPDAVTWDASLEKIHGITLSQALTGDSFMDAAAKLGTFIAQHFGFDNKITTFGYNVNTFHLLFLEQILQSEELYFKFDDRSIDLFPLATLINKFTAIDTIKALFGEQQGPISSPEYIGYYIKIYKFLRLMVNKSLGS